MELAEQLIGKGYQLKIYDKNVDYARVHGANREYINAHIPHVSSLLTSDLSEVVKDCDVMVLGNRAPEFDELLHDLPMGKKAVDLVGFMTQVSSEQTQGICW